MACMVCVEYNKDRLTSKEALSNIGEMIGNPNNTSEDVAHLIELTNKILDQEVPFEEWNSDEQTGVLDELDQAFGKEED